MSLSDVQGRGVLRSLILTTALLLGGCGALPVEEPEGPATHSVAEVVRPDVVYPIDIHDPWEGFNRRMYRFNYHFDDYVFLPVVDAYRTYVPGFLRQGVRNFFSNLGEIRNFMNNALQLKGKATFMTASRFAINTTLGLAGITDPATEMGIRQYREDFGQTLGHWGVGTGPFLVLPVLGPSNVRDTGGLAVDAYVYYSLDPLGQGDIENWEWLVPITQAIDKRDQVEFRYYETGSPFEYELVRKLWTRYRELEISR